MREDCVKQAGEIDRDRRDARGHAIAKQDERPTEHAEQAQVQDLSLGLSEVTVRMQLQVAVVQGDIVCLHISDFR